MYWFGIRQRIAALAGNLTTLANAVVFEEMNRLRELTGFEFRFGTTPYITCQMTEVPCGMPLNVQTTQPSATVFTSSNPAADRRNIYDVSIDRLPIEITEIESIEVRLTPQAATVPSPTVELYITTILVGTLLKGLAG